MLDVIVLGPLASREQMQIISAHMDVANCSAQITGQQLLMGGLFNVGLGWAAEVPGMLLEDGAQGAAAAAEGGTTLDELSAAANRAAQDFGTGRGPVYGTRVHAAFRAEVEALGRSGLRTEVSYLNGAEVPYGTPGSIRIDVGQYSTSGQIEAVFDLKTGSATLTPARIQQIQQAVGSQVPVTMVRP